MSDNQDSLLDESNDQDGSAVNDQQSDSDTNSQQNKDENVPKSVYERTKKDMEKYKTKLRDQDSVIQQMKDRLAELENSKKGDDGKNDWKSIAEKRAKDLEAEKARTQSLQQSVIYNEKHRAVYAELKKLGLRDEAERLLEYEDFADLEVETTSKGRINVLNAKEWADNFYKQNMFAFVAKKVPSVNSTDGRNTSLNSEKITAAMVVEAEMKYLKSRKDEDKARFQEFREKFVKQQARRA